MQMADDRRPAAFPPLFFLGTKLPPPLPDLADWPHARIATSIADCCRRVRRWTVPSNRSPSDWFDEMQQVVRTEAWEAEKELFRAEGIDFDSFIMRRVLGRAIAHYRRELRHAQRFELHPPPDFEQDAESRRSGLADLLMQGSPNHAHESVLEHLRSLPEEQRWLLEQRFLHELAQSQLADVMGVSQAEVSRRIKSALLRLKGSMAAAN